MTLSLSVFFFLFDDEIITLYQIAFAQEETHRKKVKKFQCLSGNRLWSESGKRCVEAGENYLKNANREKKNQRKNFLSFPFISARVAALFYRSLALLLHSSVIYILFTLFFAAAKCLIVIKPWAHRRATTAASDRSRSSHANAKCTLRDMNLIKINKWETSVWRWHKWNVYW